MCTTCGCGVGDTRVDGKALPDAGGQSAEGPSAESSSAESSSDGDPPGSNQASPKGAGNNPAASYRALAADGRARPTAQGFAHSHRHGETHTHAGGAPAEKAGTSTGHARLVQVEEDILSANNAFAAANRRHFAEHGIFALNLVSSPGSGKTTLLCRTIEALRATLPIAVIEGDQQTSRDAERIRASGVRAVQINTGKGCHLDAHMVGHACDDLQPDEDSLLLIENVGNLVCPAAFDLGEAHKVVILSVTEGDDKPLKYPAMFHAASLMLLNKVDLLPYVDFNVELAVDYARRVNPALQVVALSATSGEGFAAWLDWLQTACRQQQAGKRATIAALQQRISELEAQLAQHTRS
ncbi:MAG TPA: hydrogenase nickel incorporation protein HypB [Accumulibacter sp.]|uniref:hydrogenase nickel incorporation protein HypB n=1 Tax=Accumulibacter sp. TaxID=2053492 RepID=UPI00287A5F9A|nr:hydrogenase nickel incorporation protein HypB [Accumulibacter sp.]MDS4054155.1 hydrogenase nickel incorporation protein HypB [Accumulibacter sp.]HMV04727.1 hydrogenase nickel incorporation protein HypB [Accumulibacter sp.]HMW63528.1 hydrogenase nickel incorporation protein HypB [Accumulibacter sp.]HNE39485.1 hydrogenase nickel incorporation protein HypB [Accumulibacter sp.]HNI50986.1 hydrogenase nickel incorporation protein HypB [Accumulibacter sp.]